MIGQTISHYMIIEKLGGGGMGIVYKAHDLKLDRFVALKFLPPERTRDPEAKTRFIHEAKAASALQHSSICTVHDIDETDDGQLFIVMDCYEGETLKKKIERGPLPIAEAAAIAHQIAQGLSRAHEAGIVHRDIKPANIMVTNRAEVKIVDFGLAKLSGRTLLTKSGTTLGTAAYMSPEQARGEQVDQRSDIWSLGIVLYEMLTGKRPFDSEYEQALVYSIINQDPRPMRDLRPEVPEAMEKICQRAMAKDVKDRYQTAAELINDLESYRTGTRLSEKTLKVQTKKRIYIYAALAVIVIVIGVLVILSTGKVEVFDRIAVLPFRNLSGEEKQEWLADAMTEEVTSRLQEVAALRVPSSRGVMKYKNSKESSSELARILHAKALVDASVLVDAGGRVRVLAKLIEPSTDFALWSASFDGTKENILELQSRIAQAVVKEVRVKVSQAELGRLGRFRKKVDPQAYELCLRARQASWQLYSTQSKSQWDSSLANLQRAIDIEPDNAFYYATLVGAYDAGMNNQLVSSSEALPKLRVAAETAMKLDPELAESHYGAMTARASLYDFREALLHSARALELSPGNFTVNLFSANLLTCLGRWDEALLILRRLHELDPVQYSEMGWVVGQDYFFMRRYDDAIVFLQEWLQRDSGNESARWHLAMALSMKGLHVQALAQCDSMKHIGSLLRPALLARAGNRTLAAEAYKRVRIPTPYYNAQFFAVLGERDTAFRWLARAYRDPEAAMIAMNIDPFMDNLRDDPRFKELLKKMNLLD
ncbi:hypothetical protein D4R75_05610 [bacterium]|nr:MAG: hypothetical protein D4R75_05610 [bacterium]